MPLDVHQRLRILSDILRSHQLDCCGTVSEYEQAGRLAQTLLNESGFQEDIRNTFSSIQQYTEKGARHNNPEQYILENHTHLDEWVQELDQLTPYDQ
ncbi:MAG TPA: YtzH-like family protein [Bacillales bacterium]